MTQTPTPSEPTDEGADPRPTRASTTALRIGGVLAFLGVAWLLARHPVVAPHLSADGIAALVADAGALGVVVFIAAFSAGSLMQIPGIAFLVAARLAFGPVVGVLVAYVGAVAAISVGFVAFRGIGGRRLQRKVHDSASSQPGRARRLLERMVAQLEGKPVRTLAFLRTFFIVSPPLTATLAMSPVRFRDHLVGSALGLFAPVCIWVLGSGPLLACLGWSS